MKVRSSRRSRKGTPVGSLKVWIGETLSQETPLFTAENVGSRRAAPARDRRGRASCWSAGCGRSNVTMGIRPVPAKELGEAIPPRPAKPKYATCMVPYRPSRRQTASSSPSRVVKAPASRRRSPGSPTKLRAKGYDVVGTREPGGSPGAEAVRHVLLSGAAEPFGPNDGSDAVRRRALRPCRAGDPAGGRARRDRAVRPLPRFQPRLSGRDGQSRSGLRRGAGEGRDQRHDARHDADPRHRSGSLG